MTTHTLIVRAALIIAILSGSSTVAPATAQAPAPAEISFHFLRLGMAVPEYHFVLREDGSGTYTATVTQLSESRYEPPTALPAPTTAFSTQVNLPPEKTANIFAAAANAGYLQKDCASTAKNIADTGMKTLSYTGPKGTGRCVYNYTSEKPVVVLTEIFEGMSFTFESGRRLAHEEKYDRLGLDREMNTLVDALKDGRAEAPELIAPELRSLVNDDQVMQRVRRNASILLDKGSLEK